MKVMRVGLRIQSPEMGALPQAYAATEEIGAGVYYDLEKSYYGGPIRADHLRAECSTNPASAARPHEISEDLTSGVLSI